VTQGQTTEARMFQSAPGDEAGRNGKRTRNRGGLDSFNPLPAMKPGGTAAEPGRRRVHVCVSIRSRR